MSKLAPIVLFVYNRPWHTQQTLEALSENDLANQSVLYIYADGPKFNATEKQRDEIRAVRTLIKSKQWCGEVIIIESEHNLGLADSIIRGVTEVVTRHGKVIVLEDDIVAQKGFLRYMNDALSVYEYETEVMQISAYIYPCQLDDKGDTTFLRVMACWGWATWSRAWKNYNHDVNQHVSNFATKKQIDKFNIEGHAHFYYQLQKNVSLDAYTWAVRWYASWLYAGGISLFPTKSLIDNIGFDSSGDNTHQNAMNYKSKLTEYIPVFLNKPIENIHHRKLVDRYFYLLQKKPVLKRLISKSSLLSNARVRNLKDFIKGISILFSSRVSWYNLVSSRNDCVVEEYVRLADVHHIYKSRIGRFTYISRNALIHNTTIGRCCSIGSNFISGQGIHPTQGISTSPMFYSNYKQNGMTFSPKNLIEELLPVVIGNDVFIGDNVTVLSGITIGDGAVIGAGAVVSKNIPPYAIAVGCPVKILRYRFCEEVIEALLRIQWWNFENEELKRIPELFFDIDSFIKKYNCQK